VPGSPKGRRLGRAAAIAVPLLRGPPPHPGGAPCADRSHSRNQFAL